MMFQASALKGYTIEATDGSIGTVSDLLFDDRNWTVRWLVIDTGSFLPGRKVLIHPVAVAQSVHDQEQLLLTLTRAQIEASPDLKEDAPVSRQMETHVADYYGWDPYWGSVAFGTGAIASPLSPPPLIGGEATTEADMMDGPHNEGDPHLRSAAEVIGYRIAASDGDIGHVEDFQIDDHAWEIRYMIVDTRSWWRGVHVLVSPRAVQAIDWSDHEVSVSLSQAQLRASPPWNPNAPAGPEDVDQLDTFYRPGADISPGPDGQD